MAQYSQRDVVAMQQDAIRRVQEMQRRAQEKILPASTNSPEETDPPPEEQAHIEAENHIETPSKDLSDKQVAGISSSNGGGLLQSIRSFLPSSFQGVLDLDNDKILLILLLFFLQREGADTLLILALIYVML